MNMISTSTTSLGDHYSDKFYDDQIAGSLRSARKFAAHLIKIWHPRKVVDLGCGRGTWLKAFHEQGASKLRGLDGPWNSQEQMIESEIEFAAVDLRRLSSTPSDERYDLAISLEVAEHLEVEYAGAFIDALTRLSDVVMFGAAFLAQGGVNHLNEQPHTFWQKLFEARGYAVYDLFRAPFWKDAEVEFWYAQNTFLYVRRGSSAEEHFLSHGRSALSNVQFMDVVHPALYELKLRQIESLQAQLIYETQKRQGLKGLLPGFVVSAIERFRSTT